MLLTFLKSYFQAEEEVGRLRLLNMEIERERKEDKHCIPWIYLCSSHVHREFISFPSALD